MHLNPGCMPVPIVNAPAIFFEISYSPLRLVPKSLLINYINVNTTDNSSVLIIPSLNASYFFPFANILILYSSIAKLSPSIDS
jgi:hypothetical protein